MPLYLTIFAVLINLATKKSALGFEIQPRIISGINAKLGQFPWHVVLKNVFMSQEKQVSCGGSLISKRWVLTAAHCIYFWPWIYLEFGTTNLYGKAKQTAISQTIYLHNRFEMNPPIHDIGVVKLKESVTLSGYVQPISLPTNAWSKVSLFDQKVIVIGFGKTSDKNIGQNNEQSSTQLNFASLKVISDEGCGKYFEHALNEGVFCCKGLEKNEGACTYDSGGSVVKQDTHGAYTLIGIVSYRPNLSCEIAGLPTVFTKITSYLNWIEDVTKIKIK